MSDFTRAGQTDNNRSLTETSGPTRLIIGDIHDGEVLTRDGDTIVGTVPAGSGGGGSVTSVGLSASPTAIFNVSGSPVTVNGTLALSLDDQAANKVLAGPASGADATPSFRSLVTADLSTSIVTTPKIDTAAVTTAKLADSAVTTAKIDDAAVTTAKIDNNAVTFAKMQTITDKRLLGNDSGGTAVPQEIALSTDLAFTGSQSIKHVDSVTAGTALFGNGSLTYNARGHVTAKVDDPYTNGSGLVRRFPYYDVSLTSLQRMFYVPELNKMFALAGSSTGSLLVIERITDLPKTLATYASKVVIRGIYSAVSGKIYLNYGSNSMSVNATTGAIITSGIAKQFQYGVAIRPSDGVIYGATTGGTAIHRINSATDTAGSDITISKNVGSASGDTMVHCPISDSIHINADGNICRIDCTTNLEAGVINNPWASSPPVSATAIVYHPVTQKIYAFAGGFGSGGSNGFFIVIDPSVNPDAISATVAYPDSFIEASGLGQSATRNAIALGNYIIIGTALSTPQTLLVYDVVNEVFAPTLNSSLASSIIGTGMAGIASENVLYTPHSTAYQVWRGS